MVIKIQGVPIQTVVVEKKENVNKMQVALTVTKVLILSFLLEVVFSMFGGGSLYTYIWKGVVLCFSHLFSVRY